MKLLVAVLMLAGTLCAAKVHVLEQLTPGTFKLVVHYPTAVTSNVESVSWVSIRATLQAAPNSLNVVGGSSALVLSNPAGPGEIATAENNDLTAGTSTEFVYTGDVALVDQKITEHREAFEIKYVSYGQLIP